MLSRKSYQCIRGHNILNGEWSTPGRQWRDLTCSKIDYIPYNLILTTQFNDSSILITVISWLFHGYFMVISRLFHGYFRGLF